jgi:HlyD family secretion protein
MDLRASPSAPPGFPRLLALLLLATLAVACEPEPGPLPVVGTLERDRLELVAEARERIVEVLVTEGDEVAAGDVLMRLDQSLVGAELAQAQAAWERAEQRLAELVRGPREQQIETARAELEARSDTLREQRREYARVEALVQRGAMAQAELDRIEGAVGVAEANVEAAEARLADLLEGTTREQLAQARAGVAEAEAAVGRVRLLADRLVIRAPRAGVIDALPYELGERPPAGATVIVLLAGEAPYARVYVPEPVRAGVAPGLLAEVRIDGVAEPFAGTVRWVASEASFTPYYALTQRDRSRLSYVAEVTLTEPRAADLPTGVPVEVDFPALRPASGAQQ